jgi:hypothetical protein
MRMLLHRVDWQVLTDVSDQLLPPTSGRCVRPRSVCVDGTAGCAITEPWFLHHGRKVREQSHVTMFIIRVLRSHGDEYENDLPSGM